MGKLAVMFKDENSILLFSKVDSKNKMVVEIEDIQNKKLNVKEINKEEIEKLILFLQEQIK
jgi:hypothetical protein